MKIATVAYAPSRTPGWVALDAKLDRLIGGTGADLVVLPEYAAMDAALCGNTPEMSPKAWRDLALERSAQWVDLVSEISRRHGRYVLAGTGPTHGNGGIANRAWLCAPSGEIGSQDKIMMTPYEREVLDLVPGDTLRVFNTALGKIGVLICYDSEFPLLARSLVEAGVDMILVPSCTDLPAGQTRVRQSCRARAIEGQCLIVQAPLVGEVPGCDIIESSIGRAGIFAPPDIGQPPDGIIAQGETGVHGAVVAEVDPAAVAAPRHMGQVGNFRHWPEQVTPATRVETVMVP